MPPRKPLKHQQKKHLEQMLRTSKANRVKELRSEKKRFLMHGEKNLYSLGFGTKQLIANEVNIVLSKVQTFILQKKTPVILLPDTSMRVAGSLFASALLSAFPEIYVPLRKYLLSGVLFLSAGKSPASPEAVKVPEVLRKIPNLAVLVLDEPNIMSASPYFQSQTHARIFMRFKEELPSVPVEFIPVTENAYNTGARIIKTIQAGPTLKDRALYAGRGGVLKLVATKGNITKSLPACIVAKYKDYQDKKVVERFFAEHDLKKEFAKIGYELGEQFREKGTIKI